MSQTLEFIIWAVLIVAVLISLFLYVTKEAVVTVDSDKMESSLKFVNEFIRKEFLFELIKWLQENRTVINVGSGITAFFDDIRDPEKLNQRIINMTALIYAKSSEKLKRMFHSVYSQTIYKGKDDSVDYYFEYISRQVMFFCRKVNVELTNSISQDTSLKFTDIINNFILSVEGEIYKINGIVLHTEEQEYTGNQETQVDERFISNLQSQAAKTFIGR